MILRVSFAFPKDLDGKKELSENQLKEIRELMSKTDELDLLEEESKQPKKDVTLMEQDN